LGQVGEGSTILHDAWERRRRTIGADDAETIAIETDYCSALIKLDRTVEAEPLATEALERSRRVRGEDHPGTLQAMSNYARVLGSLDRKQEAEALYREALDRSRRTLGATHPDTLRRWRALVDYLRDTLKQSDEADELERQLRVAQATTLPTSLPISATAPATTP
jgi:ParB-like chromosome segregation protein Spo0J